jgi:hypothetical protein
VVVPASAATPHIALNISAAKLCIILFIASPFGQPCVKHIVP